MSASKTRRSHVLVTLGVLFTLGGASRFMFANFATAEETPATDASVETVSAAPAPDAGDTFAEAATMGEVCFSGDVAEQMREDQWLFETEREELRQEQLELEAWQQELERQTAELQSLQQTLDARWSEMQTVADGDMQHLAQMYGAMKADEAALIFDQMDPSFAAGFLRLLPSEQAGQILAGMDTDRAYVVSVEMASRNRDIRGAGPTN